MSPEKFERVLVNALVTSPILDIKHEFTKNEVLEIWEKYVYEGRLCLHQILDVVCPEWHINCNCVPD